MKVNGKHLDVQDVPEEDAKTYKGHPFDKHPIMNHFEDPASSRSPEKDAKWRKEHEEYQNSSHMDDHFNKQQQMEDANPEAFKNRGKNPSSPVHGDVDPLDVKAAMSGEKLAPKTATKAASKEDKELSSEDKQKAILDALPPGMRDSFLKRFGHGK